MKFNLVLKLFCLLLGVNIYAQQVVIDSLTGNPIESAHISYKTYGLITNKDGYFEVSNDNNLDSLLISHLSYKSKRLSWSNIKNGDTIFLQKSPIVLDEVVVKAIKIKGTVLKAINNINKGS